MRKLKLILIIVMLVLISSVACNILRASGVGTSAGLTLLEPVSAKAAGMSESACSLSGDVYNFYYNPAGITSMEGQEVSVMYKRGLGEDTFSSIIYGRTFSFASLVASILYYDTGEIVMYDTGGNKISKTGQRDIIFIIGYGKEISKYPTGINLKYISSEIFGEKASGFAVDLGWQYRGIMKNLDIGLAVRNIGPELKYIDKGDPLPLNASIGSSYTKKGNNYNFLGSLDIPYYINAKEVLMLLGVECAYRNLLALRVGYRLNLTDTSREDEPLNLGFGVTWKKYIFDYAIGITKNLSNPHTISIRKKF